MTKHHYDAGRDIERIRYERNWPFYGLIQAAMRGADTDNLEKLKAAWPEVYEDLKARYDAPHGILPTDKDRGDYYEYKEGVEA